MDLSWCERIIDVSMLGTVHTLLLRGCKEIKNVRTLGAAYTLDLTYCNKMLDVSMLSGVHTLCLP